VGDRPSWIVTDRLIDGTGAPVRRDVAIHLRGGRIAEIREGVRPGTVLDGPVLDLRDCTVLAAEQTSLKRMKPDMTH
jgi:dihydroorotase-like cyclic amidohydrolase